MLSKRRSVAVLSSVVVVLCLRIAAPRAAEAPGPPSPAIERPWAANVSEAAQNQAMQLFEAGNKLFEDSQYAAALAQYRQALEAWDHPAIRYNVAVALINLDQPLAAYENLEVALRYGETPLAPETYQQALTYRKLLRGQLAELKVSCGEAGADVTLDGARLFVPPGQAARWLMPGAHQLVARKLGFVTETRSLSLVAGKSIVEDLALQEIPRPPRPTRRWSAWKPWAVVGGGALLALVGVPLILDAKSNFNTYDAMVTSACSGPSGCAPGSIPPSAVDARDRGRVEDVAAVSLFSVGGALIAGGVALVVLNQPRLVPVEERSRTTVTPIVGPGLVGLALGRRL